MKRSINAILLSMGAILITHLIMSAFLAGLLQFVDLKESNVDIIIRYMNYVIFLGAGGIAGYIGQKRGWLLGCLLTIAYSFILFIYQHQVSDFPLSWEYVYHYLILTLFSTTGGIIGVQITIRKAAHSS
ncbi:putative membrane protein, TIGR04086 family [Pelagirhabdus alkalitolerans]|uniref:Putative membrane protein, TIGR04086 family n=1 Tax=Pelagirhabdus alkalitolerans TaxID=1612202 RepID=A0A1G6HQG5_9BACI|nr:TIGR04086 family membrane protein [Pelagirhabdus alkalitolerans]SDB96519.1 putative membrane protein, TIGR04086 family [Pelagirhabdus alkalitolerans]